MGGALFAGAEVRLALLVDSTPILSSFSSWLLSSGQSTLASSLMALLGPQTLIGGEEGRAKLGLRVVCMKQLGTGSKFCFFLLCANK